MAQPNGGGRPAPCTTAERVLASRASAPCCLLAATMHKTVPGRSLGPPPIVSKRLGPIAQNEREYLVNLIRTIDWSGVEASETKDLYEMASEAKTRQEINSYASTVAQPRGRRLPSEKRGDRRPSGSPEPLGSAKAPTALGSAKTPQRSNPGSAKIRPIGSGAPRAQSDQSLAASGKREVPPATRSRGVSSGPRAASGSPTQSRRPSKDSKQQARSPSASAKDTTPRGSGGAAARSPSMRRSTDCTTQRSRTPVPKAAQTAASQTRTTWPRRAVGAGSTAAPPPAAAGSRAGTSPRLSGRQHLQAGTGSAQVHSQRERSSAQTGSRSGPSLPSTSRILPRSRIEPGSPEPVCTQAPQPPKPTREAPQPPPPSPSSPEASSPTSSEWPSAIVPVNSVLTARAPTTSAAIVPVNSVQELRQTCERPALRELQPQAVALRNNVVCEVKKPILQKVPSNTSFTIYQSQSKLSPLTSDSRVPAPARRVLIRTQECRQLDILEDGITTPRRQNEQQPMTPANHWTRVTSGQPSPLLSNVASQRLRMLNLSTSTSSSWSLGASEDSPGSVYTGDIGSTWSAGLGSSPLEQASTWSASLERSAEVDQENVHAGNHAKACGLHKFSSPATPSTPFFGTDKVFNEIRDMHKGLQESEMADHRNVQISDACARALRELKRNTSLLRLTTDEEMTRLIATSE